MITTSEFIREKFFRKVHKKVDDEAIEEIKQRFNSINLNLDYEENRKNEETEELFNILMKQSSFVAEDAKRDTVTKEDLDIMSEYPKKDVSIPTAPIKRLIDENCGKKASKEASMLLASILDDYCIVILKRADEIAETNNHHNITIEDIHHALNLE